MSKIIVVVSVIILFIISGVIFANDVIYYEESNLGKNYEISGVIKDSNGNNVPGCTIELIGPNNTNAIEVQDGKFKFNNISEGQYKLKLKYDNTKFEVESITQRNEEIYTLASDYSICFMYPETSEEIAQIVDELANKIRYISYTNSFKKIRIYECKYNEHEDLETATRKIMQDSRNHKLIVAFANNAEFMEKCKEKQTHLSVLPNVSRSAPYRILGIYLNGNIQGYMDGLYNNFFIGYQGEVSKQPVLDKIYETYNNIITKTSLYRGERKEINYTEYADYIETDIIQINNWHDNDITNSISVILRQRDNTISDDNPVIFPEEPVEFEEPEIQQVNIPITVPAIDPNEENETIEIKISKKVVALKLILPDGTKFIDESEENNGINWSIPSNLKVISLDEELMHGSTIQIEYEMTIENTSDTFDLENIVLWDCLNYQYNNNIVYNHNLELLTNENETNSSQNWESISLDEKDCLKTTISEIRKGESHTKKLVVSKVISTQKDEMYYENHMMIESLDYEKDGISQSQTINTITEQNIRNNSLTGVVKSPNIIMIPPTGKK